MGCLHGFWIGSHFSAHQHTIIILNQQPLTAHPVVRVPEKVMVTGQTELKMNQQGTAIPTSDIE